MPCHRAHLRVGALIGRYTNTKGPTMSSLLQHHGCTTTPKRGRVELLMYLTHEEPYPHTDRITKTVDSEPVKYTRPNGSLTTCPKLYRVWRKPVGMWGCWVVFRYNNEKHVPDLSVPIGVDRLPRDAEALTHDEATRYWFS